MLLTSFFIRAIITTKGDESMVTAFGKLLRKIRIDGGEVLKNMADKLGVTSSYLSAVENGKRQVPTSWVETISTLYGLDEASKNQLSEASLETQRSVKLDFSNANAAQAETAMVFARFFNEMDDEMAIKIRKLLSEYQGGEK